MEQLDEYNRLQSDKIKEEWNTIEIPRCVAFQEDLRIKSCWMEAFSIQGPILLSTQLVRDNIFAVHWTKPMNPMANNFSNKMKTSNTLNLMAKNLTNIMNTLNLINTLNTMPMSHMTMNNMTMNNMEDIHHIN